MALGWYAREFYEGENNMGSVSSLNEARQKRGLTTKVYDCGKCQSQAARLDGNGHVMCGGTVEGGDGESVDCDARWACDWYEPTDLTSRVKHMRPRMKEDGLNVHRCGHCLYPFFHIQSDGSITCYREACKRKALFRWQWLEGVR